MGRIVDKAVHVSNIHVNCMICVVLNCTIAFSLGVICTSESSSSLSVKRKCLYFVFCQFWLLIFGSRLLYCVCGLDICYREILKIKSFCHCDVRGP